MSELIDRTTQIDRFKEFVRSYGYELDVSDSGVSIEELLESFKSIASELLEGVDENAGTD